MGMTLNEWNGFGKPCMKSSYVANYPRDKFSLGSLDDLPQLYIVHFIQYIHQYDSSIVQL